MNDENYDFGELKEIGLRKVWNNEATRFTKWLVKPENLALLNSELDMEIEPEEAEAQAGRYFADIKGQTEDERTVVIENQLEPTDHDHLGKILVYAAGLNAKVQIWIVPEAREEHQRTVNWLNEHSDEYINVFLVELKLWAIDDSRFAPKFRVVCKPDNLDKTNNAVKTLYRQFWDGFRGYCRSQGATDISTQNAPDLSNYNVHIGDGRYYLMAILSTRRDEVSVKFRVLPDYQSSVYPQLIKHKEEVEQSITTGTRWEWKEAGIKLTSDLPVDLDSDNWDEAYAWILETLQQFRAQIPKHLQNVEETSL